MVVISSCRRTFAGRKEKFEPGSITEVRFQQDITRDERILRISSLATRVRRVLLSTGWWLFNLCPMPLVQRKDVWRVV